MNELKHLKISSTSEVIDPHISMEGLWDSIKNIFKSKDSRIKTPRNKTTAQEKKPSTHSYHDFKLIEKFFQLLNNEGVEFKEGTVRTEIPSSFFVAEGALIPDLDKKLVSETMNLQRLVSTAKNVDHAFYALISSLYEEGCKAETSAQFQVIWDRNKTKLLDTPVKKYSSQKFFNVPGSKLVYASSKLGQVQFDTTALWEYCKASENTEVRACTKQDLVYIQKIIKPLIAVIVESLEISQTVGGVGEISQSWKDVINEEEENFASGGPAENLERTTCWFTERKRGPWVCYLTYYEAFTILDGLVNWIKLSLNVDQLSKINGQVLKAY